MKFSWRWWLSCGLMGLCWAIWLGQPSLLAKITSDRTSNLGQLLNPGRFNPSGKFALVKTLDDSEQGHIARVNDLVISPDGKVLISASRDKTIKLWDLETRTLIGSLAQDAKEIYSVAISPDGQTLASGSADETIKIWNLALNQLEINSEIPIASLKHTKKAHEFAVRSVAISDDGETLATASPDKTIKLWNLATLEEEDILKGHESFVWAVAFSPDGGNLASGSYDETVRIWNLEKKKKVRKRQLKGHEYPVLSVTFSPDGQILASGSNNGTIKLWNLREGEVISTLARHTYAVMSLAFSPDGEYLASGGADNTIKIWDPTNGEVLEILRGHIHPVTTVAFTPDGKTLVSGSADRTIKIWQRRE